MNAPLLWLVLPVLLAVGLYFLRHLRRITVLLGVLLALTFAVLAMWHPIGELITIGPISYRLESTLSIFGRQFILENSDRPILVLTHLLAAFWFSGAYITRTSRIFIPLSLVIVSLLTAALAVEPFLYAALIIELVALVSIPLLSPPGQPLARGVLRFLSFQTFGMPFILFVGWILAGVETSPGDLELVATAMILIGLGFAFMLGIFPFHTWIPLLAEAVHPYLDVVALRIGILRALCLVAKYRNGLCCNQNSWCDYDSCWWSLGCISKSASPGLWIRNNR
jgi:formate hydrogenlyase subunit 3/multisubunit Na+/H+ antiporter MnhD subunit